MSAIYKLVVDGCIRYVGTTQRLLASRLVEHISEARNEIKNRTHKNNWLRGLERPPSIELIEHTTADNWAASEIYWIALARDYGCRLVNGTDGGQGGIPTAETRAKISAAFLGKKKAPESIAKRSASRRGKPAHPNTVAALIAANTGRKRTPETCAKISAKAIGRKASPAAIEKNRAGHLGKSPSLETREKLRLAIIGRKHTPEAIANMCAAALRRRGR